jgi:hypothetical protein
VVRTGVREVGHVSGREHRPRTVGYSGPVQETLP